MQELDHVVPEPADNAPDANGPESRFGKFTKPAQKRVPRENFQFSYGQFISIHHTPNCALVHMGSNVKYLRHMLKASNR